MEIQKNEQIIWVPEEAAVLTAGVEVKNNRLEVEIVGWGSEEKSWSVDYKVLQGNPAGEDVWKQLDDALSTPYEHESGVMLKAATTCIGGEDKHFDKISNFIKETQERRIWAVKDVKESEGPAVGSPSMNNPLRVKVFPLRVDILKDRINKRLKIKEPAAECMYFPVDRDEEFLKDAVKENQKSKIVRGKQTRIWILKRPRNESLNCSAYAMAAFYMLNPDIMTVLKGLAISGKRITEQYKEANKTQEQRERERYQEIRHRKNSFVNRWKNW
jgi:phage terminase large subunit GpA-like protein